MEIQNDNQKTIIRVALIGAAMTLLTIMILGFGLSHKEAIDTTKVIVEESVEITDEVLEE